MCFPKKIVSEVIEEKNDKKTLQSDVLKSKNAECKRRRRTKKESIFNDIISTLNVEDFSLIRIIRCYRFESNFK